MRSIQKRFRLSNPTRTVSRFHDFLRFRLSNPTRTFSRFYDFFTLSTEQSDSHIQLIPRLFSDGCASRISQSKKVLSFETALSYIPGRAVSACFCAFGGYILDITCRRRPNPNPITLTLTLTLTQAKATTLRGAKPRDFDDLQ